MKRVYQEDELACRVGRAFVMKCSRELKARELGIDPGDSTTLEAEMTRYPLCCSQEFQPIK